MKNQISSFGSDRWDEDLQTATRSDGVLGAKCSHPSFPGSALGFVDDDIIHSQSLRVFSIILLIGLSPDFADA